MPRFSASISGTYPNQVITVRDANRGNEIVSQTQSFLKLHTQNFGTPSLPLASASIRVEEFERTIPIPGGTFVECGYDIIYEITNNGVDDAQAGSLNVTNFRLGDTVQELTQWTKCEFWPLGTESSPSGANYPGTKYFPGSVFRNATYNVACYLIYNPIVDDHPVKTYSFLNTLMTPSPQLQCEFQLANNDGSVKAVIKPGETKTYRVCVRIGDRTNIRVAGADSAEEWIWLLATYRDHFRSIFGKPDYRSMGGFDGRPCCGSYLAPGSDTNVPRVWQSDSNNPTTGSGYEKVADGALARLANNVKRNMIWALSGWHVGNCQSNYPFRFATGVMELNETARSTIAPAMKRIRDGGMQQGFWWGLAGFPEKSSVWDQAPCGSDVIDPDNPSLVAKAHAELDLAVTQWGAQLIGLDAFGLAKPSHTYRWLQMMKARHPGVLFVTEQALPDYVHVLAPTYVIEQPAGSQTTPFWLHHFINPGSECWIQLDAYQPSGQPAKTPRQRVDEVTAMGYTPVSGFFLTGGDTALDPNAKAADRWSELGETSIAGYDGPLPDAQSDESIGKTPNVRRAIRTRRVELDMITIKTIISLYVGTEL